MSKVVDFKAWCEKQIDKIDTPNTDAEYSKWCALVDVVDRWKENEAANIKRASCMFNTNISTGPLRMTPNSDESA